MLKHYSNFAHKNVCCEVAFLRKVLYTAFDTILFYLICVAKSVFCGHVSIITVISSCMLCISATFHVVTPAKFLSTVWACNHFRSVPSGLQRMKFPMSRATMRNPPSGTWFCKRLGPQRLNRPFMTKRLNWWEKACQQANPVRLPIAMYCEVWDEISQDLICQR